MYGPLGSFEDVGEKNRNNLFSNTCWDGKNTQHIPVSFILCIRRRVKISKNSTLLCVRIDEYIPIFHNKKSVSE